MIERLQGVSMLWRQTTSVVVRGLGRAFFYCLPVCLLFPPPSFGYDFVIGVGWPCCSWLGASGRHE